MNYQLLFNIAIGACSALGGFIINSVWNAVKDLQGADRALTEEVNSIHVLIAGDYVKQSQLQQTVDALFKKIDKLSDQQEKIIDKLERKADKYSRHNDFNND